jgi:hypothetical protein
VIKAPGATETAGQANVTAMVGAVAIAQEVVTVFVTDASEQISLPMALKVADSEQALAGTV